MYKNVIDDKAKEILVLFHIYVKSHVLIMKAKNLKH